MKHAPSDIIATNTFSSTTTAQGDYDLSEAVVYSMNVAAAQLAKRAALDFSERTPDRPRFVASAIGLMNRTLSISPERERRVVPCGHVRSGTRQLRAPGSRAHGGRR